MGKVRGHIQLTGGLDNLVYYNLNGQSVVRTLDGNQGYRIRKGRNFVRVRENNKEFGHAIRQARLFRTAINWEWRLSTDKYAYQRLNKLFLTITKLDRVSRRGERKLCEGLKDPHASQLIQDFKYRVRNSLDDLMITEQSGDSITCSFHPWIKEEEPISIRLQAITITLMESASYRAMTEPIAVLPKQSIQLTFPAGKEEGCILHIVFAELKTKKGEEGRIWVMTKK